MKMESTKTNVLILVDWFTPGFRAGGPIRSVSNLVKTLQNEFNFYVLTSNRDLGAEEPYNVEFDKWLKCEDYWVYYADSRPNKKLLESTIAMERIDLIYFNSMFSSSFTIRPLRMLSNWKNCPQMVIAPRGMLSPQALKIKSSKKKLFLLIARTLGWYSNVRWHSTSPEETKNIEASFKTKIIVEARNLGWLPKQVIDATKKQTNVVRLLTISRIAPIKNLHVVFEILERVPSEMRIQYSHIGPIEDGEYWERCLRLMARCGPNIEFEYIGEQSHEEISTYFLRSQLLLLLSESENFGHVVLEAFAHGLPCIVSQGTPWRHLEDKMIGFDLSSEDLNGLTEKLSYICKMSAEEFGIWSNSARSFAEQCILNDENLINYKKVFSIEKN